MSKRYKLLKDLPDVVAGAVYQWNEEVGQYLYGMRYAGFTKATVEGQPGWFSPVEEETAKVDFLTFLVQQKEKCVKELDFERASEWRLVERYFRQHQLLNMLNDKPVGKYISLDEVVSEYLKKTSLPENWKPAIQEEKGWEILVIRSSHGGFARKVLKYYDNQRGNKGSEYRFVWDSDPDAFGYYEDFILGSGNEIFSVKRTSDKK